MPDFLEEGNIKNCVKLNSYLSDFGNFLEENLTKMDKECQNVDYNRDR